MRVLIVDDSPMVRRLVERTLRDTGANIAEVLDAGNGLDALKVLHRCQREGVEMSLILTDICMPVMDGLELIERIKAEGLMPTVPVVVITSECCELDVRRALNAGVSGYLRKPFSLDQMKTVVGRLAQAA